MSKIGIIAGSGVDELLFTKDFQIKDINTKYGAITVKEGMVEGKKVIFLNRHGLQYCSPHEINFRGNIQALQQAGVEKVLATAAVGSMDIKMKPGNFVLLSDFIDFTRGRVEYFNPADFTDVSSPYNEFLRKTVQKTAAGLKIKIHPSAVYVCTEGPRFESKAEIKMFKKLGGDVVGMTNMPEVVLAAEADLPYAVIGVVTNYAAGISPRKITSEEVISMMKGKAAKLSQLLQQTIKMI